MKKLLSFIAVVLVLTACSQKNKADLFVYNATIYTIDSTFSSAEAMVIRDGKILDIGKKEELEKKYDAKEKLDAGGKFIYPGFIDAHAHFMGYAESLTRANLVGTTSWDD